MANSAKFDFRYIDRVLERPELRTLICSALRGSFVGCTDIMDDAFRGLTKRQRRHFSKLLTKIWSTHAKRQRQAQAKAQREFDRSARVAMLAERELAEDLEARKFTPTWTIVETKNA